MPGWFNETLPPRKLTNRIAFLRLDGDLYASTWDALTTLYPLVVDGGAIYIDDYGSFTGCRKAVDKYRALHRISERMHRITPPEANTLQEQGDSLWWIKRTRGRER